MVKEYKVFKMSLSHSHKDMKEWVDSSNTREEAECIISEDMINSVNDISTYYIIEEFVI